LEGYFAGKKRGSERSGPYGIFAATGTAANVNTHQSLNKLPVLSLNRQYNMHSKKFKINST
jgi:hypothetical protein